VERGATVAAIVASGDVCGRVVRRCDSDDVRHRTIAFRTRSKYHATSVVTRAA